MPIADVRIHTKVAGRKSCRIPFEIVNDNRHTVATVPVSHGLCVPRAQLFRAGPAVLEGLDGSGINAWTEPLSYWNDGSIRWLLMHFVADGIPGGRTLCHLTVLKNAGDAVPAATVIRSEVSRLTISTSGEAGSGTRASSIHIEPQITGSNGRPLPIVLQEMTDAVSNDMFDEIAVTYTLPAHPYVSVRLTLQSWVRAGLIKLSCRIRNSRRAKHMNGLWDLGDDGSFHFNSLNIHIADDFLLDALQTTWKSEIDLETRTCPANLPVQIQQNGSGGAAWNKHRGITDCENVSERGYTSRFDNGTLRGPRASPVTALHSEADQLTMAIPEFWQNFPIGVTCDDDGMSAALFPPTSTLHELQGGEQKSHVIWLSTKVDSKLRSLDWTLQPPRVTQPNEWVREADVFEWLPSAVSTSTDRCSLSSQQMSSATEPTEPDQQPSETVTARYNRWVTEATSGPFSIAARRDRANEFGWRNYGDLHADHEQPHYTGWNTITSHYNNQFDLILGGILNLCMTGDPSWFELFEPLARHTIDIDIYHTDEDRSCFSGGLFWHTDHFVDAHSCTHRTYSKHNTDQAADYGGGPSNEHNYTTGLLYYYFLTGNKDAYEAVLSLADWVIRMDDGTRTIWGALDSGPTGLASQTVSEDFHGPGRGAGNSINALVDAWTLTDRSVYLDAAEGIIRRVVHPSQNIDELDLSETESRWSYTVCLLALGRYLNAKKERGQFDEAYAYAHEVMQAYGVWMLNHEKPALEQPDKLKLPTVAWAAQEFRKANVLRIAANCTGGTELAAAMRHKADHLVDQAWIDLNSFGEMKYTARCLSILLTEGLRDLHHRSDSPGQLPHVASNDDWEPWQMFVPQKQRVKALFRNPVKLVRAISGLLHSDKLRMTIDAVKRRF